MLISVSAVLAQSDLKSKATKSVIPQKKVDLPIDTAISNQISNQSLPNYSTKTVTVDTLDAEEDAEPLDHQIIYNARDSIRYETKGQKIYLFGDGFVQYEEMNLKAEFIEIDNAKNTITAYGKTDSLGKDIGTPLFKDGDQEIACRKMIYNLKTKKGKIFDVKTKE